MRDALRCSENGTCLRFLTPCGEGCLAGASLSRAHGGVRQPEPGVVRRVGAGPDVGRPGRSARAPQSAPDAGGAGCCERRSESDVAGGTVRCPHPGWAGCPDTAGRRSRAGRLRRCRRHREAVVPFPVEQLGATCIRRERPQRSTRRNHSSGGRHRTSPYCPKTPGAASRPRQRASRTVGRCRYPICWPPGRPATRKR